MERKYYSLATTIPSQHQCTNHNEQGRSPSRAISDRAEQIPPAEVCQSQDPKPQADGTGAWGVPSPSPTSLHQKCVHSEAEFIVFPSSLPSFFCIFLFSYPPAPVLPLPPFSLSPFLPISLPPFFLLTYLSPPALYFIPKALPPIPFPTSLTPFMHILNPPSILLLSIHYPAYPSIHSLSPFRSSTPVWSAPQRSAQVTGHH